MEQYSLDTSAFAKAIVQLEQSLHCYNLDLVQANPILILQLRAAAIQAFEFTYELSWKMLKRYLKITSADPQQIESMSFTNLIRTGCEQGLLLSEVAKWKQFRHARSITSHTYDQEKAAEVFADIPDFLEEAHYLLKQLDQRKTV